MGAYRNYYNSLTAFCNRFAQEQTNFGRPLTVVNFDAYADIESLPDGDLTGLSNFSLTVDEEMYLIEALIGVSTDTDSNNMRLGEIVDRLFDKLHPLTRIPYMDAVSGAPLGHMVILDGTMVMPVAGTDTRPGTFIQVSLRSDRSPSPAG